MKDENRQCNDQTLQGSKKTSMLHINKDNKNVMYSTGKRFPQKQKGSVYKSYVSIATLYGVEYVPERN